MRAEIWLDEETGRWRYDVRSNGLRRTGGKASADEAVAEVLAEITPRPATRM